MQITPMPSGLPDLLPPYGAQEFRAIHRMLKYFMGFGYAPVIPPMMEFESGLIADQGAATARQIFRLMDPLSREMLALRADITSQLVRIAQTSLGSAPRPLRLSYAGYTLRTAPEPLRIRRQHTQIGIELFGASSSAQDAEIIAVACGALEQIGLQGLCLDISYPRLLETLLEGSDDAQRSQLRDAVARKDASALRTMGAMLLAEITEATGPYHEAMRALQAIAADCAPLKEALEHISQMQQALDALGVALDTTLDILELRGFGYYSGVAFSLFMRHPAQEVGRGGRYKYASHEEATGFTCYMDDVLTAMGEEPSLPRIGVAMPHPLVSLHALQQQGYEVVGLYADATRPQAHMKQAIALGCTHLLQDGEVQQITA